MDLKKLAKDIGNELVKKNARIPHATLLEIVAKAAGHESWNHAAAAPSVQQGSNTGGNSLLAEACNLALPHGYTNRDDAKQLGSRFLSVLTSEMVGLTEAERNRAVAPLKAACSPMRNLGPSPYKEVHTAARNILDRLLGYYPAGALVMSKREIKRLERMTEMERSLTVNAKLTDEHNRLVAFIDATPWLSSAGKEEIIHFAESGWAGTEFLAIAETCAAANPSGPVLEILSKPSVVLYVAVDEKKAKAWLGVWRPDLLTDIKQATPRSEATISPQ